MAVKTKQIAEFGDFQTPDQLARHVCSMLAASGLQPAALVEPTCGMGSFLFAGLDAFTGIRRAIGADINAEYVNRVRTTLRQRSDANNTEVVEADFFTVEWDGLIASLPEPVLVIGNPPWVTNAHLGVLGSRNLPTKSNFQNHNGFDALTGKANFDISESILIRLMETMNGRHGMLAMLCKASVARKALYYGWKHGIQMERSCIYRIDADFHFDVAVEAVLLVTRFRPKARDLQASLYPCLIAAGTPTTIGYEDDTLLADIPAYHKWKHLAGDERLKWRSGIKHDCSKVMEVRREGHKYRNGLGELVTLEEDYLYPMLKSSDVANGCRDNDMRWMIVTQKTVGADTADIKTIAPRTWEYLTAHADLLDKRASTIYRNRPPYSIFGVGNYSFAHWKVAISGFYKKLTFRPIGPSHNKPVMLDDTSYFLSCQDRQAAEYLSLLLNSSAAQAFYRAFLFWDAKRPITVDLLRRLDLRTLAGELKLLPEYNRLVPEPISNTPLQTVLFD